MKKMLKECLEKSNEAFFAKTHLQDLSIALLRIFFGTSILMHGIYKAGDLLFFSNLITYMGHPIAGSFAPFLAYGQILVGLLLVLGLFTRASALITFFATMYTVVVLYNIEPLYMRELGLAYFFISLLFIVRGGARYSLDDKLHHYFEKSLEKLKIQHI